MKHLILFLILILSNTLLSAQTGTIKIAKPKSEKKDTIIPSRNKIIIIPSGGMNYTFKGNDKIGYEFGLALGSRPKNASAHRASIGLQYCIEQQYFRTSEYVNENGEIRSPITKLQSRFEYLKLPLECGGMATFTGGSFSGRFLLKIKLVPEYLLNMNNNDGMLHYSDFRPFNLAGGFTLGTEFKHFRIGLSYSKDFFENLKNQKIYDSTKMITGIQKSKTNLLSFSVTYNY
jgi:hypothetical protein